MLLCCYYYKYSLFIKKKKILSCELTGTWSLLLLTAPGFFFFFTGHGEVSAEEWPLDDWEGLGIFLFGATLSVEPASETADNNQRSNRHIDSKSRKKYQKWQPSFLELTQLSGATKIASFRCNLTCKGLPQVNCELARLIHSNKPNQNHFTHKKFRNAAGGEREPYHLNTLHTLFLPLDRVEISISSVTACSSVFPSSSSSKLKITLPQVFKCVVQSNVTVSWKCVILLFF